MELKNVCQNVVEIARSAGAYIVKEAPKLSEGDIEHKGIHNFVTHVDKNAEKQIVDALKEIIPHAGFIAEEGTMAEDDSSIKWIVDPLDGTTNFIHGLPCFSVSIALMKNNEVILGVVYEANQEECFYAWKGGGAWLNGKPIRVSTASSLNDSLLATGFPYYDYSRLDSYMDLFTWCLRNTHGVRRIGSAAVDLAYVACGRFEGFFEYSLSPWDVAAGALLVQEAGGMVCDFSGKNHYIFGKEIVASNGKIHQELMPRIQTAFN